MSQEKPPSKQQQILDGVTQLRTAVVGIPGTADQGLVGEVKEMRTIIVEHASSISRLCALHENAEEHVPSRKKRAGILGGIVTLIVGAVVALVKAFSNGDG